MAVDLVGMLAAAHQVVPEALHALAQRDSRFKHSRAGGGRGGGRGPGGVRARPPPPASATAHRPPAAGMRAALDRNRPRRRAQKHKTLAHAGQQNV